MKENDYDDDLVFPEPEPILPASISGLTLKKTMNQMDADWQEFSKIMEAHIPEQRKKYEITNGLEMAQILPAAWALGDAFKYTFEVVKMIEDPDMLNRSNPREVMKENILKAAHTLQITYTKLCK